MRKSPVGWKDRHRIWSASVMVLNAFLTLALLKSNNFTEKSRLPDTSIGSLGWNSKHVTSSKWSYKVLITGWPPVWSPGAISSGADLASILSTSKILIEASTEPVAINWPSDEKAPALQFPLWDVTYAVSYCAGSGAWVWVSVSNSRSNPGPKVLSKLDANVDKLVLLSFLERSGSWAAPINIKWSSRSEGGHGGSACIMLDNCTANVWWPS